MLQIALAPAPIALQFVQDTWRRLFVTAGQTEGEPHFPTGSADQRGLDEIVTQNFSTQRRRAGQASQPTILYERRDPQNRVMSPIITFPELPETETSAE